MLMRFSSFESLHNVFIVYIHTQILPRNENNKKLDARDECMM